MPIGSIIGGLIGQGGAQAAGSAYGAAAQNADNIRLESRATYSPWLASGFNAQDTISQLLGLGHFVGNGAQGWSQDSTNWQGDQNNAFAKFRASPDYNFRFNEGQRALDRSAASKGMLLSGAQTKASQEYGGNLASGEYNNWFNKLSGMGGQGLQAAGGIANSNLNALGIQNQDLMKQASSYSDAANALASGIGKGVQNLGSIVGFNPYGMFGNI